ncbi:M1 family metallopeptidase [Flavobacterium sp. K5-23]|uniref:M1 family metallopeptidase n=1 Tax=Flavobacterium sp. K5-23 TaxID=2746225 RepID=UPI002010196E|nr:M1 family metallopeptidase [Flavobacterium sp. K5-23]UQD56931.1 M1 family metallopeptidase [Flavobacterium sp. K5-23]
MKYLFLFLSTITFAQQTQYVDFKSVLGKIAINPKEKSISGDVDYQFEVLQSVDTIKIDAQNMVISNLKLNGSEFQFVNTGKQLQLIYPFTKGKNQLTFHYSAIPKQTLYFVDDQIWTQGQGKYTSHWFPSFDDVNEKLVFNMNVVFNENYQVISNGVLQSKSGIDGMSIWNYAMQKSMSSYLLMLAIGKFDKHLQKSKCGIPLELYIENKDSAKFEPSYRYSQRMFDFLEKKIGVKYPWEIYKQIPVRDFLYAGMENTSATLFSTRYIVDTIGFEDRNYINVNAHELAHQWFGNLITAQSGKHHWLQEGFATYYALLAERDIFGDDYFYSKLYESAQNIKYASRTDTIPVLNAKASSLSFYQKGAWSLFVLHNAIGDKAFNKAVRNYLKKHSFQTVITQDFFDEIKKVSDYDLDSYSKEWLESTVFNNQLANELLSKNKTTKLLLDVESMKRKPLSEKEDFFVEILNSDVYGTVKEAVINQLKNENFFAKRNLLKLALDTQNIQVRQAVASSLTKIPEDFRTLYETLLEDKSYQTQEFALYQLWNNFPEHRASYLDKTKDWIGFNDYNLKTLWLSLAISTPNYSTNREELINELVSYSSTKYEATTRQKALEKLIAFRVFNDVVLKNLVNSTTHHTWQFTKFGRDNLRALIKKEEMKASLTRILPELNETEQFQLNRLLIE